MRENVRELHVGLLLAGALSLFGAGGAAAEVVVVQEGGGRITVEQNGETMYDRSALADEAHVYVDPPLQPGESLDDRIERLWGAVEPAPEDPFETDPFFAE